MGRRRTPAELQLPSPVGPVSRVPSTCVCAFARPVRRVRRRAVVEVRIERGGGG